MSTLQIGQSAQFYSLDLNVYLYRVDPKSPDNMSILISATRI